MSSHTQQRRRRRLRPTREAKSVSYRLLGRCVCFRVGRRFVELGLGPVIAFLLDSVAVTFGRGSRPVPPLDGAAKIRKAFGQLADAEIKGHIEQRRAYLLRVQI